MQGAAGWVRGLLVIDAKLRVPVNLSGDPAMVTTHPADTDLKVRDAVVSQLDWDPEVDTSELGVAARNGVVTLTGYIDTYAGKLAAERAAKHVRGVRAVANDLEVRLRVSRTDSDIATDAARALTMLTMIPDSVQATVHDGHVTLTGSVPWMFQRLNPERAVRHIRGVRAVHNYITVAAQAVERDVRHRIMEAMHRHADIDARKICVAVAGDVVTLSGTADSWLQREEAEHAAERAPGIATVDNRIVVEPPSDLDANVDEMC
jgi:osmotically-inducible protein OsmY